MQNPRKQLRQKQFSIFSHFYLKKWSKREETRRGHNRLLQASLYIFRSKSAHLELFWPPSRPFSFHPKYQHFFKYALKIIFWSKSEFRIDFSLKFGAQSTKYQPTTIRFWHAADISGVAGDASTFLPICWRAEDRKIKKTISLKWNRDCREIKEFGNYEKQFGENSFFLKLAHQTPKPVS